MCCICSSRSSLQYLAPRNEKFPSFMLCKMQYRATYATYSLACKYANWGIMYSFTSESRALFGFNFTNSVEHMACSFRVDPLFNCTFVPVSVLFYLCCIPVFLVEIAFSFLAFSLPSVFALCSCLHPYLLPVSAILSSDPTLSRLCVCVWSQKIVYLCHTLSPKLDMGL